MKFVLICGLSGAGRSQASKFLEEIGFLCIDNVPCGLFPEIARLLKNGKISENTAVSVDLKDEESALNAINIKEKLKQEVPEYEPELLFIDCDDGIIVNRYKEMKRFHPLAHKNENIKSAITRERALLDPVKKAADNIIDTSKFSIWHLKAAIRSAYEMNGNKAEFMINISSFGFKKGIPAESDNVYDVRFVPNPYYVPELKNLTGLDDKIKNYVFANDSAINFVNNLTEQMQTLIPLYKKEGKTALSLSFGCTGGHHRSVAIAEEMAKRLLALGYVVSVVHRDL